MHQAARAMAGHHSNVHHLPQSVANQVDGQAVLGAKI